MYVTRYTIRLLVPAMLGCSLLTGISYCQTPNNRFNASSQAYRQRMQQQRAQQKQHQYEGHGMHIRREEELARQRRRSLEANNHFPTAIVGSQGHNAANDVNAVPQEVRDGMYEECMKLQNRLRGSISVTADDVLKEYQAFKKTLEGAEGVEYVSQWVPETKDNPKARMEFLGRDRVIESIVLYFAESGELCWAERSEGEHEGKILQFYPSGEVFCQYVVKDGAFDGEKQRFFRDGTLLSFNVYENKTQNGPQAIYFPNGQPSSAGARINGKREGTIFLYLSDGTLYSTSQWEANKKIGNSVHYRRVTHSDLEQIEKGITYLDFKAIWKKHLNGEQPTEGNSQAEVVSDEQPISRWIEEAKFLPRVRAEYRLADGVVQGKVSYYAENGKLCYIETFKDDELHGEKTQFYPTGEVFSKRFFIKGAPSNGEDVSYYRDGTRLSVYTWKDGVMDGPVSLFFPNGNLGSSATCVNGMFEGPRLHNLPNGTLFGKTYWRGGREVGRETSRLVSQADSEKIEAINLAMDFKRLWKDHLRAEEQHEEDALTTAPEEPVTFSSRVWSDNTGKHKVTATFVRFENGKVTLRSDQGKERAVPLKRLSQEDVEYLRDLVGKDIFDSPARDEQSQLEEKDKIIDTQYAKDSESKRKVVPQKRAFRIWTDNLNRKIKARLIEQSTAGIKLQTPDGGIVKLPLHQFSARDRNYLYKLARVEERRRAISN